MIERQIAFEEYPHEECGVFGIYAPDLPVAELTYMGLLSLQHRGQDAAGIAVSGEGGITVVKGMGLVDGALDHGEAVKGLGPAEFASGHVLYSTTPTENPDESFLATQPMFGEGGGQPFALSHNGHIINYEELKAEHPVADPVTDSALMTQLVADELDQGANLVEAATLAARQLNGAFTTVIMGRDQLIGMRDPKGFRPLMLGSLPGGGSVLASEQAALDIVKAQFLREIAPGELVSIGRDGVRHSYEPFDAEEVQENLCAFEYVYFSRPDNEMMGENVEQTRFRMGQELARVAPVDADIVVGVPNSGVSATHGYVDASGIPMKQGLTKNQYVGRSFIAPTQEGREGIVRAKLNVNRHIVEGQRVILIDDSIVRSTTTRVMVEMMREAGAKEVHLRISSPPYKWPCFYGMKTGDINELIAAKKSVEDIREEVEADSLAYLPVDSLKTALGTAAGKVCMACMTGEYATPVPPELLQLDPSPEE